MFYSKYDVLYTPHLFTRVKKLHLELLDVLIKY